MGEDVCPARAGTDSPATTHMFCGWDGQHPILVLKKRCAGKYLRTPLPEPHKARSVVRADYRGVTIPSEATYEPLRQLLTKLLEMYPSASNERAPSLRCADVFSLPFFSL